MKPSDALKEHREEIRKVAEEFHTRRPRVFGSVAQGADTEESDLDLLVDPTPETTLLDIARIQNRLQQVLGISVDVLTPKSLPPKGRDKILAEAVPV